MRESCGSPPSASRDAACAVRVVERELAEHAGAEHRDVLPALARGRGDRVEVEQRADVDALEALRGRDEQPRPVRRREDQRLGRRLASTSRGELPKSKPSMRLEPPLARELRRRLRVSASARASSISAQQRTRSVARRERLADRRGRAEDVDDDPDRRRSLLSAA